jgi:hypothetical protein
MSHNDDSPAVPSLYNPAPWLQVIQQYLLTLTSVQNGYVSFTPVGIKTKKKNRRLVAALPEQPQGSLTEVPVKVPDPRTIAQLKWTKANEITVKYGEDDDHEVVIGHLRSVAEEV